MNVHELINLPYAGMAEKKLRDGGMWKLTPEEKMRKMMGRMQCAIIDASDDINDALNYYYKIEEAMETQQ